MIAVSHLVSRREIPFDVPITEAATADNVRATVDSLVTFTITDPYRFVYNISADDFDHVFQAVCQEALRAMVRKLPSERVSDLAGHDKSELKAAIGETVAPTGWRYAPPSSPTPSAPDFVRSQEARQLAVLQRAEQIEHQTLAQARQTDEEALSRQQALARWPGSRTPLQAEAQRAEARRRLVEAEASVEALRLAHLEERLQRYPQASQWEWEGARLRSPAPWPATPGRCSRWGTPTRSPGPWWCGTSSEDPAPADRLPQPGRPDESVARERGPAAGRGRGEPRPVGRTGATRRPGATRCHPARLTR